MWRPPTSSSTSSARMPCWRADHPATRCRPSAAGRRNVRRHPRPSASARNAHPASAARAARSIGASGSVASTTSAAPGGTPASARRALTAGSGQARPRASSVVSIRSVHSMIAVILASERLDRLYTGLSLLVSTAAEGERAVGLATFGALAPLLEPRLEAPVLRDTAGELPDCTIWACAAAVETTGADRVAIDQRLDGVRSTPHFLRDAGDARLVVV